MQLMELRAGDGRSQYWTYYRPKASMRLRSFDRAAAPAFGAGGRGPVFSRGRFSSVQNSAVHLHLGQAELPWFVELQALARKDLFPT